jgi:hypothetical protein
MIYRKAPLSLEGPARVSTPFSRIISCPGMIMGESG